MGDKVNRRDLIIEIASKLFIANGYEKTSVREIAVQAKMTEAALYYHFKDKRDLLQAVVTCQMPDLMIALDQCRDATSLHDLVVKYCTNMARFAPAKLDKMRWIMAEFPNLTAQEKAMFHTKHLAQHIGLAALVEKFVADPEQAQKIASTMICAMFGYGQLFLNMEMNSVLDFKIEQLAQTLADSLSIHATEATG